MSVYAVHPVTEMDLTSAQVYGEIKYINGRYLYADEIENEKIPDKFWGRMTKAADDFNSATDYLLIAGDHLQIVALAALLIDKWGKFRVLRYDRQAQGYVPILIQMGE